MRTIAFFGGLGVHCWQVDTVARLPIRRSARVGAEARRAHALDGAALQQPALDSRATHVAAQREALRRADGFVQEGRR